MKQLSIALLVVAVACRGSSPQADPGQAPPPESEPPVALNPEVPIAYPPGLFEQKVEADVILRLYVDSTGKLVGESTRVAESSGYPALDSAALAGAFALRFAPAKRHGVPVATAFLQPVEFRQVGTTRTGTAVIPPVSPPPTAPAATPARQPPPPPPPRPPAPPPVRRDTTRARTDSAPAPADTTQARPDTSGSAH
jgi:TonB family protein